MGWIIPAMAQAADFWWPCRPERNWSDRA